MSILNSEEVKQSLYYEYPSIDRVLFYGKLSCEGRRAESVLVTEPVGKLQSCPAENLDSVL